MDETIKRESIATSLVEDDRKGLSICFISSYPPNHARLSEYAKNLVPELANRAAIDKLNLLSDQISSAKEELAPKNSKIKIKRVWKEDHPLSILGVMIQVLKLKPNVVHFNLGFQSYGKSKIANLTGLSLVFLCRLCGLKVIVILHNIAELVDLRES